MKATKIIEAMRAARGPLALTAKEWIPLLRLKKTAPAFGHWLRRHIGERGGPLLEFTLEERFDSKKKRYKFAARAEDDHGHLAAELSDHGELTVLPEEVSRLMNMPRAVGSTEYEYRKEAAERRKGRHDAREKLRKDPELRATLQAIKTARKAGDPSPAAEMHEPPTERDFIATVDRFGGITRDYLPMHRAPDEPKVALPDQPKGDKWHPGCGRPFTVADAVAAHPRETYAPAGGGSRRGGVAAINPIFDNGEDSPSVSAPNGIRLGRNGFNWKDWL